MPSHLGPHWEAEEPKDRLLRDLHSILINAEKSLFPVAGTGISRRMLWASQRVIQVLFLCQMVFVIWLINGSDRRNGERRGATHMYSHQTWIWISSVCTKTRLGSWLFVDLYCPHIILLMLYQSMHDNQIS